MMDLILILPLSLCFIPGFSNHRLLPRGFQDRSERQEVRMARSGAAAICGGGAAVQGVRALLH